MEVKMELMSMTDFVLAMHDDGPDIPFPIYPNERKVKIILNYARFLKQPLALWMFVPCDDAGNVLQEIKPFQFKYENRNEYAGYKAAKERCLFEGFKIVNRPLDKKIGYVGLWYSTDEQSGVVAWRHGYEEEMRWDYNTAEELIFDIKPELTPAALKQIFG